MHPAKDNLPTPIDKLDALMDNGDTSAKPYKIFVAHNLGNRAFLFSVPMHDFYAMSEVANDRGVNGEPIAQRKLDPSHAHKLAVYILKGLLSAAIYRRHIHGNPESPALSNVLANLGSQPYLSLQPIVANIRSCDPEGANITGYKMVTKEDEPACFKVMLSQKDILWVIDGQHRRKGMDLVFEFLGQVRTTHRYLKKGSLYPPMGTFDVSATDLEVWNECNEVARGFCTISVEAHLGLDIDKERQLFHDLNNLGKKVEASLALQFDSANPVNQFTQEVLFGDIFTWTPIEKDIVNWQEDNGQLTRKDVVAVNAHLFLNKSNINGAKPLDVEPRKEIATRFWIAINEIPGFGQDKAKLNTIAAQPVVLKALAKLTYDFAFNKRKMDAAEAGLETLLEGIPKLDFSHTNPMWRYYELSSQEREENGLTELQQYLPSDNEGYNRDLGKFDPVAKVIRFGAKHNDIFPVLGDMIRWKLRLPSRHNKSSDAIA